MSNDKVPCFTSFIDASGKRHRAHPSYNGKVWNDYAIVKWKGFSFPFPAFIHTFVDLRKLPKGRWIHIIANVQIKIEAGLYALIHSFDPVREDDLESPNILVPQGQPCSWCTSRQSHRHYLALRTSHLESNIQGTSGITFS